MLTRSCHLCEEVVSLLISQLEHEDISEFLDIGTEGNPIQELTHGVTVTDQWMEEMVGGDTEKKKYLG